MLARVTGPETPAKVDDQFVRERAGNADNFDPTELQRGHRSKALPTFALSVAPILVVLLVNLLMSLFAYCRGSTAGTSPSRGSAKPRSLR